MLNIIESYWSQYLEDYIDCLDEDLVLDDNQKKEVLKALFNRDDVWIAIDNALDKCIEEVTK